MFPPEFPNVTAASLVPSLDEVMSFHSFVLPGEAVFSVQVAPESVEVQMFPPSTTAASLVPSLDEVMPRQALELPTEVSTVHMKGLREEDGATALEILSSVMATSLVNSLDEVMEVHVLELPE